MILKNVLLTVLTIIGVIMIYLGVTKSMLPPGLTGIGFLIIVMLLLQKQNK